MSDSLSSLVEQTRRLSQTRPEATDARRKRRGEVTLPAAKDAGGLPTPRLVEPEPLPEPPAQNNLFDDFSAFGQRISNLMEEAQTRNSRTRRCTPFTTSNADTEVIARRRRKPSPHRSENALTPPAPDHNAGKLAAFGIAVLSMLAVAMVVLSSPNADTNSRAIARKPMPALAPEENEIAPVTQPATVLAGTVEEPGE